MFPRRDRLPSREEAQARFIKRQKENKGKQKASSTYTSSPMRLFCIHCGAETACIPESNKLVMGGFKTTCDDCQFLEDRGWLLKQRGNTR